MKLYFVNLEFIDDYVTSRNIQLRHHSFCFNCQGEQYFYWPGQVRHEKIINGFCSVCGWMPGPRRKIPEKLRIKVFETDGFQCVYCGSYQNITIEHIIPHSHGGELVEENLLTACKSCNSRRHNGPAFKTTFGRFQKYPTLEYIEEPDDYDFS